MRFGPHHALLALALVALTSGQVSAQGENGSPEYQLIEEWTGTISAPSPPPAEPAIFTVVSLGATVIALGVCGFLRYARDRRGNGVIMGGAAAVAVVTTVAYLLLFA